MRDYSSEEHQHPIPRSSQGNNEQYHSSIEAKEMIDNENISLEPSSPRGAGSSLKGQRGQQPMRNSLQKNKKMTLEQLRNIPNPKDLFTKRDREQFALLLGLSEDDFPSSP